jgi:type I restriction enzyme S subunit
VFASRLNEGDRPRVDFPQLAGYPIKLPPLPEQHRIVAKIEELFTKVDAGVDALKKARAQLGRYRQAVLKAAVAGELTREWREAHMGELEPAADLLARILQERRAKWEVDQLAKMQAAGKPPKNDDWKKKYQEPAAPDTGELPELSRGWMWARAEQLCDFITKGTTPAAHKLFSESGQVPFIKVYNLTHVGLLDFTINPTFVSHVTHSGELARSKVFPGDVLMNIVGPPLGKVSIIPDTYEEWNINQAVAVFRPMPSLDRKYLRTCLLTREIQLWAERRAKATAGQFNLTLEICRDLPLPLPPLLEQRQIVLEVERLLSIADATEQTIEQSLKQAERLRQSILQQAFAGQLVPQDPNDEPASRLLERIREERARKAEATPKQKRTNTRQKQAAQPTFFS